MAIGKPVASVNQINALEAAHKNQLAMLAQANNFILNSLKAAKTTAEKEIINKYAGKIYDLVSQWNNRQQYLEKNAGIPKQHPVFFSYDHQADVNDMVGEINAENKLGFIPLLIWAAVAIAGFFSVDYIVDELNDTAQEKEKLIQTTSDTCKALNITPEQCQKLLTPAVTSGSSSGIWGIITPIALTAAAIYGITHIKEIKKAFN